MVLVLELWVVRLGYLLTSGFFLELDQWNYLLSFGGELSANLAGSSIGVRLMRGLKSNLDAEEE